MTRSLNRRGRTLASATAATGLVLGTLAMSSGSAQSAEPAPDCATPVDHSTLAEGDTVTALSVVRGTTPVEFTGSVLGVIDDGIGAGLDMIMIDFTDSDPASPMAKAGGIWQGMSGSPVYVGDPADGNLVGSIAYGLSYGPSPIAGVTPFADMDDYLGDDEPAPRVEVGSRDAAALARSGEVSRAQAAQGFRQLRVPIGVSGLGAERLEKAQKLARKGNKQYLRGNVFASGVGGRASDAVEEDLFAGGNLAASISYGDVTYAGVGTATSVCDGEVVGFGHPFSFLGGTTLGLNPASAIYIQPDSAYAPFKVANISPAVGTITDDRLTGITGEFGAVPEGGQITSTVTYRDRSRTGSSEIYYTPYSADVTFGQQIANHDRVVDGIIPGGEDLSWTITGTDEAGAPFEISFEDRYVSNFDITFESSWDLADTVYVLSTLPDVTIDSITTDAAVDDDATSLRVSGLEQKRDGEWAKVSRRQGVKVKAGQVLRVRAVLKAPDGSLTYVPFSTDISKKARSGYLSVRGGASDWMNIYGAKSVSDVVEAYEEAPSNTDVVFQLRMRRNGGRVNETGPEQSQVVTGGKYAFIRVTGGGKGASRGECRGC